MEERNTNKKTHGSSSSLLSQSSQSREMVSRGPSPPKKRPATRGDNFRKARTARKAKESKEKRNAVDEDFERALAASLVAEDLRKYGSISVTGPITRSDLWVSTLQDETEGIKREAESGFNEFFAYKTRSKKRKHDSKSEAKTIAIDSNSKQNTIGKRSRIEPQGANDGDDDNDADIDCTSSDHEYHKTKNDAKEATEDDPFDLLPDYDVRDEFASIHRKTFVPDERGVPTIRTTTSAATTTTTTNTTTATGINADSVTVTQSATKIEKHGTGTSPTNHSKYKWGTNIKDPYRVRVLPLDVPTAMPQHPLLASFGASGAKGSARKTDDSIVECEYWVDKTRLSDAQLSWHRKALTVEVTEKAKKYAMDAKDALVLFGEIDTHLRVPLPWGLQHFGAPTNKNNDMRTDGASMNPGCRFVGSLLEHQHPVVR